MKLLILGCGFGTALAIMWQKAGHSVTCYTKFEEEARSISADREHKKLLPGVKIPGTITFTADIAAAFAALPDAVVFAVPSAFMRETALLAKKYVRPGIPVVSVAKGFSLSSTAELSSTDALSSTIGLSGTDALSSTTGLSSTTELSNTTGLSSTAAESPQYLRMSELLSAVFPDNPVFALTGPSHAEELAVGVPTSVVFAGAGDVNETESEKLAEQLQNKVFRLYLSSDIAGAELGGVLKNPIAVCCGIARGVGCGDNTIAALMTRSLAEITRLGVALGASWQTFTGLSGLGDLIVTCTSVHSRNYRAGLLIGKGVPAESAVREIGTVEGYETALIAAKLAARLHVSTPVIDHLARIFTGMPPCEAIESLMTRPLKSEREIYW
ncbi:glycerol-3-phosphate dehydrogenase (NAD(P)(+)) [Clostridia bacterium]|nr:glycerol-3-phosphate dehydrogenase (NAD(P)(+)) [Clostridia bacterium]